MYNINKINKMIDDINRFFKELEEAQLNEKSLTDSVKVNAAAMSIFGIMNRAIGLASEILVNNDLTMPYAYHECFATLRKEGILEEKMAINLERITKERSLFAHHYYDLEKKKVLQLSKDIYLVKEFVERVKKIVAKEGKNGNKK